MSSTDRFLMSKYLTLSGPGAVSFLCLESASVLLLNSCDDCAKSSDRWLLGSPLSTVVQQLTPRTWYPLQCLQAKTEGILSLGAGRSEECAQEFASHIGLNQQDTIYSHIFLEHSDQCADVKGVWLSVGHIHCFSASRLISVLFQKVLDLFD